MKNLGLDFEMMSDPWVDKERCQYEYNFRPIDEPLAVTTLYPIVPHDELRSLSPKQIRAFGKISMFSLISSTC